MSFGDITVVPRIAVPAARLALQQQGINPTVLKDDGTMSATDMFSLAFDTIEIKTAFTPPVVIKLNEPSDPATQALLNRVRPTLIIRGRAGRVEVAPYGVAGTEDPFVKQSILKGAVAVGALLLGVALIKRSL